MMHIVKLRTPGLMACRADYYGYRVGLVVGTFLIFLFKTKTKNDIRSS